MSICASSGKLAPATCPDRAHSGRGAPQAARLVTKTAGKTLVRASTRIVGAIWARVFAPRRGQCIAADLVGDLIQRHRQAVEYSGHRQPDVLAVQPGVGVLHRASPQLLGELGEQEAVITELDRGTFLGGPHHRCPLVRGSS